MVSVREMERRMEELHYWLDDFLEGKISEKEVIRKVNKSDFSSFEMLIIAVAVSKRRGETRKSNRKRKRKVSFVAAAAPVPDRVPEHDDHDCCVNFTEKNRRRISTPLPPLPLLEQGSSEKGNSSAATTTTTTYSDSDSHVPYKKQRRISNGISPSGLQTPPNAPVVNKSKIVAMGDKELMWVNDIAASNSLPKRERLKREKLHESPATSPEPNKPKRAKISKKQQNKRKKIIITYRGPKIPPPLPDQFKNKIAEEGGTDTKLVIQKPLYPSDVSHHHDRFLMPLSQIASKDFLTDEEKANFKSKIVTLIDTELKSAQIRFTRWDMKSNIMYVLNSKWKEVVDSNKLKCGNIVQVWSFRVGLELRLALVLVEQGQAALG